jgi:transcriptional regulator with GAF, ATPase, and Fis domain
MHRGSLRSSYPFVSVNCAAIPRDLIASELFGHEKGSFTGATQRRLGRFELAQRGTIFLDEVGELPAETQIALLRVLQEREFERVGGAGSIRTDVRVIAATNRDLEAAIAAGLFRSDLFYRLDVFPIEIPPLRERKEDIPLLVEYFIDRYARKAGKNFQTVNKKSLDLLQSYPSLYVRQGLFQLMKVGFLDSHLSLSPMADQTYLRGFPPRKKRLSRLH